MALETLGWLKSKMLGCGDSSTDEVFALFEPQDLCFCFMVFVLFCFNLGLLIHTSNPSPGEVRRDGSLDSLL